MRFLLLLLAITMKTQSLRTKVPVLGTEPELTVFYNAHSAEVLVGENMIDDHFESNTRDLRGTTKYSRRVINKRSELSSLLSVDASTQLDILSGRIQVEASAALTTVNKEESSQMMGVIMVFIEKSVESVKWKQPEMVDKMKLDSIPAGATHVLTHLFSGIRIQIICKSKSSSSLSMSSLEVQFLAAATTIVNKLKASATLTTSNEKSSLSDELEIQVLLNFQYAGHLPANFDEVGTFLSGIVTRKSFKGGFTSFEGTPVSEFKDYAESFNQIVCKCHTNSIVNNMKPRYGIDLLYKTDLVDRLKIQVLIMTNGFNRFEKCFEETFMYEAREFHKNFSINDDELKTMLSELLQSFVLNSPNTHEHIYNNFSIWFESQKEIMQIQVDNFTDTYQDKIDRTKLFRDLDKFNIPCIPNDRTMNNFLTQYSTKSVLVMPIQEEDVEDNSRVAKLIRWVSKEKEDKKETLVFFIDCSIHPEAKCPQFNQSEYQLYNNKELKFFKTADRDLPYFPFPPTDTNYVSPENQRLHRL